MSSSEVRKQLKALDEAWASEYVGKGQHLLLHTINDMNTKRERVSHDNYLAIIQSSGTGKSRMVHEMAKLVFTIPMNVRNKESEIDHAHPRPDKELRDYLLAGWKIETETDLTVHFLKLLGHLCDCIVEELDTQEFQARLNLLSSMNRPRMEQVAQAWFDHLESEKPENRKNLFEKAISRCLSVPPRPSPEIPNVSQMPMELVADREQQSSGSLPLVTTTRMTRTTRTKNSNPTTILVVGKSLQRLMQKVKTLANSVKTTYVEPEGTSKTTQKPVAIVFYMDSAQTLTAKRLRNSSRSYYDVFCSTCTTFTELDVFFLYLSAHSSLKSFRGLDSSARVVEGKANPFQVPYTEIPTFDCLFGRDPLTKLSIENTWNSKSKTLTQASEWRFLAKFGRPLFGSFVNALADEFSDSDTSFTWDYILILNARGKLLCRSKPDDTSMTDTVSDLLALFGVRILLKFDVTREKGRQRMLDLVESHMAIAFSFPDHREYIHMGYPSEPVLAEAAARHLHHLRTEKSFIPIKEVLDLLLHGHADKGEVGELVARLLYTMAYDDAIREHQKGEPRFNYSKGVPLETFIYALFTEEHADKILNSLPDNVLNSTTTFRKAFKNFWVRFTHFGSSEGVDFINSEAACMSFVRCMAIQCCGPEAEVDVILPLFEKYSSDGNGLVEMQKQEQHLCERNMSEMIVSTKNRIAFQTEDETACIAEELELFSKEGPVRPYIAFDMNLGADVKKGEVLQAGCVPVKKSQRLAKDRLVHPRYIIHAFGCRSNLYKVVKESEEGFFQDALGFSSPLADHPRQTTDSLDAVKVSKPFWNLEKPYCDWVDGVLPAGN